MRKSRRSASFLTLSSSKTRRRMARERRGAGSSLVSMETILQNNIFEGSLEVKLPTIWRDEKQSREEAKRRERLEEKE